MEDDPRKPFVVVTLRTPASLPSEARTFWESRRAEGDPDPTPEFVVSPLEVGTTAAVLAEAIDRFHRAC